MTTESRALDVVRARERRFEWLYAEHGRAVLAYAIRRAPDEQDAADVVAETFLVAWRRLDDVPCGDRARLWLYAVARRALANQQRGERRRQRLAAQLGHELVPALQEVAAPAVADQPVLRALASLAAEDREILLLTAWEELSPAQIGMMLGITQIAARSRLHRARKRLRVLLGPEDVVDDPAQLNIEEAV